MNYDFEGSGKEACFINYQLLQKNVKSIPIAIIQSVLNECFFQSSKA
jgi:hypothetical protein